VFPGHSILNTGTLSAWIRLVAFAIIIISADNRNLSATNDSSGSDDTGQTDFTFSEKEKQFEYSTSITVSAARPDDTLISAQVPSFVTVVYLEPDLPRFLTLPELLSSAVGVTVKDFGGLGKLSTVSIRGSSANQVIVLLDGIRINTASDSGVDLSSLPLDTIEKVEILRGADSAVFGSGAIGGVINLVSRKNTSSGWNSSGGFTYASWNTAVVHAATGVNGPRADLRFTGSYRHTDGDFSFINDNGTAFNPDDDYRDRRVNNAMDAFDGSFRLRLTPSPSLTLSGNIEGFVSEKGIPGLTTFPSEQADQKDRRLTGYLRMDKKIHSTGSNRFFIESHAKYLGMDFSDPEGEQTGVPIRTEQRTRFMSGRAGWNISYGTGGGIVAVHYETEKLRDTYFGDREREVFALNGQHDMILLNGKIWMTHMLRYDTISDTGTHWSPKTGLRWFISNGLSLKTNAGYGFRAPSFNELYLEAGYITGNPDLEPEKALSIDAGLSYEKTAWRIEAAWFLIDSTDLIQYQLVSGFRYKPFNIGRARSYGIELDCAVTLGAGFTLSGSYTWDKAVDRSGEPNLDGKQIPGRPEHDMFGKLAWNRSPVSVWTEWHHLSGNYVTRSNTKELDARLTGNIGITCDWGSTWRFGVQVKNVTGDQVVDVRGFPLPPRAWFATVKVII
jgi:vitamin B12 transporter